MSVVEGNMTMQFADTGHQLLGREVCRGRVTSATLGDRAVFI